MRSILLDTKVKRINNGYRFTPSNEQFQLTSQPDYEGLTDETRFTNQDLADTIC